MKLTIGVVIVLGALTAASATAKDDPQPTRKVWRDAEFDKYVTAKQFAAAWSRLDAAAIAGSASRLAEGEVTLKRKHSSGVSSDELWELALAVAAERGDKAFLERLPKLALAAGRKQPFPSLEKALRGAGDRSAALRPPAELSPGDLRLYRGLVDASIGAKLRGDAKALGDLKLLAPRMLKKAPPAETAREQLLRLLEEFLRAIHGPNQWVLVLQQVQVPTPSISFEFPVAGQPNTQDLIYHPGVRKLAVIHFHNCQDITDPMQLQVICSDQEMLPTPDTPPVPIPNGSDHYDMYRTAMMAPNPPAHPGELHLTAAFLYGDAVTFHVLTASVDVYVVH